MDRANEEASKIQDEFISTEHLFLAILSEQESAASRILVEAGITYERFYEALQGFRGGRRVTTAAAETRFRTLEKFSRDLTQAAKEGKLDPVIGRDAEIMRVLQVLSRRTKNNPVLIGEAASARRPSSRAWHRRSSTATCPNRCWASGWSLWTSAPWWPARASVASSRSG